MTKVINYNFVKKNINPKLLDDWLILMTLLSDTAAVYIKFL